MALPSGGRTAGSNGVEDAESAVAASTRATPGETGAASGELFFSETCFCFFLSFPSFFLSGYELPAPTPEPGGVGAIAVSSSASLVNVGALVTWGPLAGQVGLAAHPFGRAWLGGQVGAGGLWEWDGPSVGLMANYAYLHAADSTEEVSAGATPLIVEENTLDERHQVGLLATGGYHWLRRLNCIKSAGQFVSFPLASFGSLWLPFG